MKPIVVAPKFEIVARRSTKFFTFGRTRERNGAKWEWWLTLSDHGSEISRVRMLDENNVARDGVISLMAYADIGANTGSSTPDIDPVDAKRHLDNHVDVNNEQFAIVEFVLARSELRIEVK